MISWFLITTLFNLTGFTIVLVGEGERLSCIPWARKTLRPNNHKGVRHSFIQSCGEKHASFDSVFRIDIDGYESEITINSTDILYSMSIVFIYMREKHVLLVQGIEEKGFFKNWRRFSFWIFQRKNVLDIKGPIFVIARVALPPWLRVNGDERSSVLANASIEVPIEDSQLAAPREATHVNDEEEPSILANANIVTADDSQLEAPRENAHVNGDEGLSVLANDSIVTNEDSQLEATRETAHVNGDEGPSVLANDGIVITEDSQLEATRETAHVNSDEGPSVLANDSIVTTENSQLEATRETAHVNGDEGPSVLANDSIVTTEDSQLEATREATHVNGGERPFKFAYDCIVTTENSQLEAAREATHVHSDEGPSVLAHDSIVITEDSQLEAMREATHVNGHERHFVLANESIVTTENSPLVTTSGEEQKLDHGSQISAPENGGRIKSIIDQFSASVKQWRSYRLNSVQKLNGYHITFLMMIAALFGYYVGLSGVTLDQIHLLIYNRIKAVMYKLMMYVMTNVFNHLKDTEFCNYNA
ncbi:hypothetical protein ABFS82_01G028000 [Erythranthe guttata]